MNRRQLQLQHQGPSSKCPETGGKLRLLLTTPLLALSCRKPCCSAHLVTEDAHYVSLQNVARSLQQEHSTQKGHTSYLFAPLLSVYSLDTPRHLKVKRKDWISCMLLLFFQLQPLVVEQHGAGECNVKKTAIKLMKIFIIQTFKI